MRLSEYVKKYGIKTITVDVFDTVLLRKVFTENRRFYMHAQIICETLSDFLGMAVEPMYFADARKYSYRLAARSSARKGNCDPEASLESIFTQTIEYLTGRHAAEKSSAEKEQMVNYLTEKELELEMRCLKPNYHLIKELEKCRQAGASVYFLSDMYLRRSHILKLMDHFNISGVFAGGWTSADLQASKGTLKAFKALDDFFLQEQRKPVQFHIGDNIKADFINPRSLGISTRLTLGTHHLIYKPLAVFWGVIVYQFNRRSYKKRLKKQIKGIINNIITPYNQVTKALVSVGTALAPAVLFYLDYLATYSTLTKQKVFFFSREGNYLLQLVQALYPDVKADKVVSGSRINLIRAVVYQMLKKYKDLPREPLIKWFLAGDTKIFPSDVLKSAGFKKEECEFTDLLLSHIADNNCPLGLTKEQFIKEAGEWMQNNPVFIKNLELSYNLLSREMNRAGINGRDFFIMSDLGWSGTIQLLTEYLFRLQDKDISLEGVYLGCSCYAFLQNRKLPRKMDFVVFRRSSFLGRLIYSPYIWEILFKCTDSAVASYRIMPVRKGLEQMLLAAKKEIQCLPSVLFNMTVWRLIRFINLPTFNEVISIATSEIDPGLGDKNTGTVSRMDVPWWKLWRYFFTKHPELRRVLKKPQWFQGTLAYAGFHPVLMIRTMFYYGCYRIVSVFDSLKKS